MCGTRVPVVAQGGRRSAVRVARLPRYGSTQRCKGRVRAMRREARSPRVQRHLSVADIIYPVISQYASEAGEREAEICGLR